MQLFGCLKTSVCAFMLPAVSVRSTRGASSGRGDAYVNDVYGKSAVTLRLNIEGGIGQINLVRAL